MTRIVADVPDYLAPILSAGIRDICGSSSSDPNLPICAARKEIGGQ
ncbi:MAG: hypothetical protein ACM3U2_17475 [Deltaproteobacteria bacterium]